MTLAGEYFAGMVVNCMHTSSIAFPQWSPPVAGSYKLNTDGACCVNPGRAAAGGIIRDSNGR